MAVSSESKHFLQGGRENQTDSESKKLLDIWESPRFIRVLLKGTEAVTAGEGGQIARGLRRPAKLTARHVGGSRVAASECSCLLGGLFGTATASEMPRASKSSSQTVM